MSQIKVAIPVQGLKKSYKNIPVLAGVDFEVKAGSIFALLAILHKSKTILSGTLMKLKKLFLPATVEYIEKQPALEEIFLAIIGKKK